MDYHIMDYNTVIKRMQTYMSKFEGDYSDWYVGITKDLDEGLFQLHKVEETGNWIWEHAFIDSHSQHGRLQRHSNGRQGLVRSRRRGGTLGRDDQRDEALIDEGQKRHGGVQGGHRCFGLR